MPSSPASPWDNVVMQAKRGRRPSPVGEVVPDQAVRMLATVVPGMGRTVARELERLPGVAVGDVGCDGRSDVLLIEANLGGQRLVQSSPLLEDVFVEIGRTMRSSGDRPHWIAGRIWRPNRVEKALSLWSGHPPRRTVTFRVVVRVLDESAFLRTELRDAVARAIAAGRPAWRRADPAQLEVWVTEYKRGRFVAGLRLSDASMRQHGGREVERHGALRPTVAATMVVLAGERAGTLLDPCCGSGTILGEAAALGWEQVQGRDIDPDAVEAAARNAPTAIVAPGDARHLDLADASVRAVVSNLPFGRQYSVQGATADWLADVLAEMARVTEPGGRVVVLVPAIPRDAIPSRLRLREQHGVRLLGSTTTLSVLEAVGADV
jgi:23S rRNA G2445 N2-methylase RlmL